MTDHDKQLITKANELPYSRWMEADDMAEEADTEEARQELMDIAVRKYHYEEYSAGIL